MRPICARPGGPTDSGPDLETDHHRGQELAFGEHRSLTALRLGAEQFCRGDGSRKDRYDVIAIGRDGRTSVYATR